MGNALAASRIPKKCVHAAAIQNVLKSASSARVRPPARKLCIAESNKKQRLTEKNMTSA